MNQVTLQGTHYNMGLQHGSMLHQFGVRLPKPEQRKIDFGMAGLPELTHFYPEIVEEINGFAQGIREPQENVVGLLLSMGVFDLEGQCSIFAFRNVGYTIFGRNYDYLYQHRNRCQSLLVNANHKFVFTGQADVFIGKMDGMNEKGLAVGMNFVNSHERSPGVSFSLIVRYLLEHCTTVTEAVNVLTKVTTCSTNNYLLADAMGDMAVVEVTPAHRFVRKPKDGQPFIYSTNHFISEQMQNHDAGGVEWSKSRERARGLEQRLQNETALTIEKAQAILSNQECFVCMDLPQEQFGTLWSVVANTQSLEVNRCDGKPQHTNYYPDKRLPDLLQWS